MNMKRMFLKALLISCGLLFVPSIQTSELGFGHVAEPEHEPIDQAHTTENHNTTEAAEALRLKIMQQEEEHQKLRTQHHTQAPLPTQDPLKQHALVQPPDNITVVKDASSNELTNKELAILKAGEQQHTFNQTTLKGHHSIDLPAQLDSIRTNIVQHLTNELTAIEKTLTAEQINNREMVITFFHKAGDLTKENLVKFHTIYKKLAQWDGESELTLTSDEQKEMKLFLQSLITTYCTKRQVVAQ